jgi:hypothetical protein
MDYRLSMRFEFIRLGLDVIVDRVSQAEHDFLDTQIEVYLNRLEADEKELSNRYDLAKINMEDAEALFGVLHGSIKNSRSYPYFISILQHCLLLPINPIKRFANVKSQNSHFL